MNNSSNFYALLNRMKYIERWSLMRNSVPDNLIEHSYQVAYITQALCLIKTSFTAETSTLKSRIHRYVPRRKRGHNRRYAYADQV